MFEDRENFPTGPLPFLTATSLSNDDFSTTLFVGDLSLFCDEKSLYEFFLPFGAIDSVQLKKSEGDQTKTHLSYGFIRFRTRESAERALHEANGKLFLGRNIRVGWAVDHPSRKTPYEIQLEKQRRSTAQIHVAFSSRHPTIPVTEASLRTLFDRFGEVVDVTIKKMLFSKEMGVQSGYGFIHYALSPEGVASALKAVETMNKASVDLVTYECSLSHGLRGHLASSSYNSSVPNISAAFVPSKNLYTSSDYFQPHQALPPRSTAMTSNGFKNPLTNNVFSFPEQHILHSNHARPAFSSDSFQPSGFASFNRYSGSNSLNMNDGARNQNSFPSYYTQKF